MDDHNPSIAVQKSPINLRLPLRSLSSPSESHLATAAVPVPFSGDTKRFMPHSVVSNWAMSVTTNEGPTDAGAAGVWLLGVPFFLLKASDDQVTPSGDLAALSTL